MIARVITAGVAIARGVGGRRGRQEKRRTTSRFGRKLRERWAHADPKWHAFMAETARRYPKKVPIGYRERRRRAKLRRRARDRDVSRSWVEHRHLARCPLIRAMMLGLCRIFHTRAAPWWSTPKGRRGWMREDFVAKRARRRAEMVGR